jgi:hypothetical protein
VAVNPQRRLGHLAGFAAVLTSVLIPVSAQEAQGERGLVEKVLIPGSNPPYRPLQPLQRLTWFSRGTVGLQSLGVGLFVSGVRTAWNEPPEYGGTWSGFSKRYGMRLTGIATGNAMEAGLGAIWGEDPRYFRATGHPLGGRVRNIVKMTFLAYYPDGSVRPAYARAIANAGSSYLSNTWRTESEASRQDAAMRVLFGVLGRMGGNAFAEFWPDVKRLLRKDRNGANRSGR